MKRLFETHAEIHSAPLGVGSRADALEALLDLHDFGDLAPDAHQQPRPSVIDLGGLRIVQLHHTADACTHALTRGAEDTSFPLQLLVTNDGHCVPCPVSGDSTNFAAHRDDRARIDPAQDAWLLGLPDILFTRWLRVTPDVAADRLDAERDSSRAVGAYLRAWRFDELEALVSPFEKDLIAEHVMGLLAMAISPHS